MNDNIIIIGGGLGGLSAGAYLSEKGVKFTLIEEQPNVGGYSVSFKRDEFIFDVALHAVPGGLPGQPFYNLITKLGLEDEITFLKLTNAFQVKLGDFEFLIPNDFNLFFNKLANKFPAEKTGIKSFKQDISKYALTYFSVVENDSTIWDITTKFIPKIPNFINNSNISTDKYLNQFINDHKLKAILYQAAVFFGVPMKNFPAINFMIMFYLLFTTGMFTIQGGGQALTDALKNKIRENGSTIITGKRINKVNLENNLSYSVNTKDGSEYRTKVLISNINTPSLVHDLIGDLYFPSSYLSALNQLTPSLSILQMHLGLDCSVKDIGISNHIHIIFPHENIDDIMSKQNNAQMIEGFSILAPGITDPRGEANIERIISIVGGVSGSKWLELEMNDYQKAKDECISQIISLIEKEYPKIKSHIKTIDLATPHTFSRYTNNPNGAILGFNSFPGGHRTLMKISRFPIKNIFLANAWTSRLGGFMQCVKSGIVAGQKALDFIS